MEPKHWALNNDVKASFKLLWAKRLITVVSQSYYSCAKSLIQPLFQKPDSDAGSVSGSSIEVLDKNNYQDKQEGKRYAIRMLKAKLFFCFETFCWNPKL